MDLKAISVGASPPDEVNVMIEIPAGGEPAKYEVDKKSGHLVVDRFLSTAMRYPCNYGFIPHTLSGDGDPADALVIAPCPVMAGSIIASRPIGILRMEDEAGPDEKLLMLPGKGLTPVYDHIRSCADLPTVLLESITHFFEHYKDLEAGKWVRLIGWGDVQEARAAIQSAIEAARK